MVCRCAKPGDGVVLRLLAPFRGSGLFPTSTKLPHVVGAFVNDAAAHLEEVQRSPLFLDHMLFALSRRLSVTWVALRLAHGQPGAPHLRMDSSTPQFPAPPKSRLGRRPS